MAEKVLQEFSDKELPLEVRIGRRIKAIRALRGVTQHQLAEACGISNQTIARIEQGKSDFRIGTMREIERVLNCKLIVVPSEDLL